MDTTSDDTAPSRPAPPAAPASAVDELWQRVRGAWRDDKVHGAFIEHCRQTGQLGEAAARYRAESVVSSAIYRDEGHAEIAKKRLAAILALAMSELAATRTPAEAPERRRARQRVRWGLFGLFLVMIGLSLAKALLARG
jgi:hypothetical protein